VQAASLTADGTTLRWLTATPATAEIALAAVDLDGLTLPDGAYALRLTRVLPDGTEAHHTARFRTHWRNMPLALYHPEVAIRTLRFIEDRDTLRRLLRGGRAEQERRVRAYWQERDPTPGTAFNELMAEYYRRVDHAANAFRTAQSPVPDGLTTDAAAVYVAYGPPDRVERSFPGRGGVEETWHYAGDRRFVFWAPTSLDPMQLQARPPR
jgi:GWxTD domain-containing protein